MQRNRSCEIECACVCVCVQNFGKHALTTKPNIFAFIPSPSVRRGFLVKKKTHRNLMAYATWIDKKRTRSNRHRLWLRCLFVCLVEFILGVKCLPRRISCIHVSILILFAAYFLWLKMYLLVLSRLFSDECFPANRAFVCSRNTQYTNRNMYAFVVYVARISHTHMYTLQPTKTQTAALLPLSSKMQTVHCAILLNFKHTFTVSSAQPDQIRADQTRPCHTHTTAHNHISIGGNFYAEYQQMKTDMLKQ